jgi:methylated-DNA-protein-cysteine methyltransferase-like protein
MSESPTYYERVFELVKKIPRGRVTNYGLISDYLDLGTPRMVGWALHQSIGKNNIPAHRVVNAKGELSGRLNFETPTRMEELLRNEGVHVENHQVSPFKSFLWNPFDDDPSK